MSSIGVLRNRISIQSYKEVQDSTFQNNPVWTTLQTVWAKIETPKGRSYFNGQQTDEKITHRITIRYQPNITSELWLLMESRRFRIRMVKILNERNRFLIMDCEEVFIAQTPFTSDQSTVESPIEQNLPPVD